MSTSAASRRRAGKARGARKSQPYVDAQVLLDAMGQEQARVMRERTALLDVVGHRPGMHAPVRFDVAVAKRIVPAFADLRPKAIRERYRILVKQGHVEEVRSAPMHWRLTR